MFTQQKGVLGIRPTHQGHIPAPIRSCFTSKKSVEMLQLGSVVYSISVSSFCQYSKYSRRLVFIDKRQRLFISNFYLLWVLFEVSKWSGLDMSLSYHWPQCCVLRQLL